MAQEKVNMVSSENKVAGNFSCYFGCAFPQIILSLTLDI
jgi:hypothetical protein